MYVVAATEQDAGKQNRSIRSIAAVVQRKDNLTVSLTLANGLNSNIILPLGERVRITGPTGAFSIGGFVPPLDQTGHADATILRLYNSAAFAMTLVNADASSTAANRILTLTGGNVVLRAGTSFATLSYDLTDARWMLESTN